MANHKPLPALPTLGPDLTTLTVEARTHRANLLAHFLRDLQEPTIESRRDGWLYVFEEVLDDLTIQINHGDWLACIQRGRQLKRTLAVAAQTKTPTPPTSTPSTSRKPSTDSANAKEEDVPSKASDSKPLPAQPEPPLKRLRQLAARPALPVGEPRAGHLVLCVSSHGSRSALPTEDSGFDMVPANIGCTFTPGTFSLKETDDDVGPVLYGLDDLQANISESNIRLIGGTFTFKGINSPQQHAILFKILKLGVYIQLSLILEQHFLSDSRIPLKFPRPKFPPPSPSTPTRTPEEISKEPKEVRIKAVRNSIIPSSFTNFFGKRHLSYRGVQSLGPAGGQRSSLDLVSSSPPNDSDEPQPRKSFEGEGHFSGLKLRRFSFMGDRRHSFLRGHHTQEKRTPNSFQPFAIALKRIEESRGLLSTSPGITLNLPKVIVELSEKEKLRLEEKEEGKLTVRKLKGDEKTALTSLLGWDGKDAEGRGMSGILGFVRQQEISVLSSLHVPPSTKPSVISNASSSLDPSTTEAANHHHSASTLTNNTIKTTTTTATFMSTVSSNLPSVGYSPCGKPHWITYRYFASEDKALGDWVLDYARAWDRPCSSRPGCLFTNGQHELRLIHDGIRIVVRVGPEVDLEEDKTLLEEKAGDAETDANDEKQANGTATEADDGEKDKEPVNDAPPAKAENSNTPILGKPKDDEIQVWESCAVCNARSPKRVMNSITHLFSFAKFLELLIYSPSLSTPTKPVCEHTAKAPGPWSALPLSRLNVIRHFTTEVADVTFALSTIDDVFELRVPRLQITRGTERASPPGSRTGPTESEVIEEPDKKKLLRKEIRKWWQGIADHIDSIEKALAVEEEPRYKALPRLPSTDDAYDVFEEEAGHFQEGSSSSGLRTPTVTTPYPLPPLPPTTPNSPSKESHGATTDSYFSASTTSALSADTNSSTLTAAPSVPPKDNSELLLATLRHNFQRIEQSLYTLLARTPETSLNDVRRSFLATGRGTQKRLVAWKVKHLGSAKSKLVGDLKVEEPDWWGKGWFVVPGGNIIVRENDWGSIIAYTLSTNDYQLEMANLSSVRAGQHPLSQTSPVVTPAETVGSTSSSFFSVATSYRLFSSSSKNHPDPDQENVIWDEPEKYSAVISRKEHARDPTSLLSIRDVLRTKTAHEPGSSSTTGSRLLANTSTTGPQTASGLPPAVKVKANVGLNTVAAGGQLNSADGTESVDKLLQEIESDAASTPTASRAASIKAGSVGSASGSGIVDESRTRRTKASSIISTESTDSQDTAGKGDASQPPAPVDANTSTISIPPPLPPKDNEAQDNPAVSKIAPLPSDPLPATSSGFLTSAFATGLNTANAAMRYVLNSESAPSRPLSPSMKKQHGLLLAEMSSIDERPHIKYEWTVGKRVKFSCTVYYAKQFDLLRKKCGIADIYLKSLAKSTNWTAEGGKSKSNFWKTNDDRFIIKTLVNAWNVADLQVLIEHAPSYFRYMDATASKPTVLAKLLGFYTVEIKNLETGNVQSKADLLVMENLFFEKTISKTFDLKGIQGRKVKTQGSVTRTLFDGEWIEGQQRTLTLVRPHSKMILRDAIKSDAEFLSKSNIMDYSLLVGVDEEKKEMACGLVDTIGSYTFAKTLEYKAKQGLLQSSKEVTVMPPAEYQERFVNALDGYFVACPDKWSKPLDDSKIISDPNLLPSVL